MDMLHRIRGGLLRKGLHQHIPHITSMMDYVGGGGDLEGGGVLDTIKEYGSKFLDFITGAERKRKEAAEIKEGQEQLGREFRENRKRQEEAGKIMDAERAKEAERQKEADAYALANPKAPPKTIRPKERADVKLLKSLGRNIIEATGLGRPKPRTGGARIKPGKRVIYEEHYYPKARKAKAKPLDEAVESLVQRVGYRNERVKRFDSDVLSGIRKMDEIRRLARDVVASDKPDINYLADVALEGVDNVAYLSEVARKEQIKRGFLSEVRAIYKSQPDVWKEHNKDEIDELIAEAFFPSDEIPTVDGVEGEGRPRRPNARAAIVKKVMGEKGLSMIEASKYVKAHGLY